MDPGTKRIGLLRRTSVNTHGFKCIAQLSWSLNCASTVVYGQIMRFHMMRGHWQRWRFHKYFGERFYLTSFQFSFQDFHFLCKITNLCLPPDLIPITGWSQWNSWTTCQVKDEWCSKERFRLCLDQDPNFCGLRDGKLQREVASCDASHCIGNHTNLSSFFSKFQRYFEDKSLIFTKE